MGRRSIVKHHFNNLLICTRTLDILVLRRSTAANTFTPNAGGKEVTSVQEWQISLDPINTVISFQSVGDARPVS